MEKYRIEIQAPSGAGKTFATELVIDAFSKAGVSCFTSGQDIGKDWVEFEVDKTALIEAANNTRKG